MNTLLLLAQTASRDWTQVILLIVVLVIAWIALRFLLRLALRVFATGCAILVILAAILLLLRYFR